MLSVLLARGDTGEFCYNGLKALFGALNRVELGGEGHPGAGLEGFSFPIVWVVSGLRETRATGGGPRAVSAGKD